MFIYLCTLEKGKLLKKSFLEICHHTEIDQIYENYICDNKDFKRFRRVFKVGNDRLKIVNFGFMYYNNIT